MQKMKLHYYNGWPIGRIQETIQYYKDILTVMILYNTPSFVFRPNDRWTEEMKELVKQMNAAFDGAKEGMIGDKLRAVGEKLIEAANDKT